MADGYNRFNPGGQYFYQNQHTRNIHNHNRTGSPITNSRTLFQPNADTPSPSRSPGTHSPAHNPYGMYNHGNHRQNHGLLNGNAGHQTYQPQLNLAKHFQANAHQNHHLNNQHNDHGGLSAHGNAFANHHHSTSLSTLSNTTPSFTPAHLQNGTPANVGGLSKPHQKHWSEQLEEYEKLKIQGAERPHYYARTTGTNPSRMANNASSALNTRTEAEERIERRRAADEPEEENVWQAIDFGGQGLKCMGASLFRYSFLKKIYFNHNKLSWLPQQIGEMRNLTTLDLSFNELYTLPPEIGMLTNLKKLLLFENKLSDLPFELGSLYQLEMLGIEGNPMRPDYVERLAEHGTQELVRYLREQADPPPAPEDRAWISLDEMDSSDADKIQVLSWNILCDRAATQAAYGYTPSEALGWQRRRSVILEEIKERNADVVCLQEVDVESYNEFFRPNLASEDYRGVFWPKSRAQTMGEKEAKIVDGCATFYKNKKYILLDKQLIIFSREAINRPDMKGEHDVYNRVMPRDHIAVVLFLENRMTGSRLIATNVHLAWEPWYADVKVIQVAILMEQLKKFADGYAKWPPCNIKDKQEYRFANEDSQDGVVAPRAEPAPSMKYDDPMHIPMLICSDMNSTRDSGVYELITQGSLSNSHPDLGTHKYGDFSRNGMSHPFSIKSSYGAIGELPFTNYTPDFKEVIDYVWYSSNAMQVTGVLGEVDPDYLRRVPGFPNYHFPSDHLPLQVELVIKNRKERKQVEADFGAGSRRDNRRGD